MPAPRTWTGLVVNQLLGALVCLGIPAAVTVIAPVSWIKFERQGDRVAARAQTCLLFVVPFRTQSVDPVTAVGQRTLRGPVTVTRRTGRRDEEHQADDEGFLVIRGPGRTAEIQVSPASLDRVLEEAGDFLKDAKAGELRQFVAANWKFSVGAGGLVSLLTVLYLCGLGLATGRWILGLCGLGPKSRGSSAPGMPH